MGKVIAALVVALVMFGCATEVRLTQGGESITVDCRPDTLIIWETPTSRVMIDTRGRPDRIEDIVRTIADADLLDPSIIQLLLGL